LRSRNRKWTEIVRAIDFDQCYRIYFGLSNIRCYHHDPDPVNDDEGKDNDTVELDGPRKYKRLFNWRYERPRK
jgi:hypothetical protein